MRKGTILTENVTYSRSSSTFKNELLKKAQSYPKG